MDDLEPFIPDRMASRILGMGDIASLVEKAEVIVVLIIQFMLFVFKLCAEVLYVCTLICLRTMFYMSYLYVLFYSASGECR